jgi:hypothetical protein
VRSVTVYDSTDDDAYAKKKQEIWAARVPPDVRQPPPVQRVTVGVVPPGWEEVSALKDDDGERLVVVVGVSQVVFDRADLQEGQVYTQSGLRTEDEFYDQVVPSACRSRGQQDP